MDKFILAAWPYLGFPLIPIVFGLILDGLASDTFKADIAVRIGRRQAITSLKATLQAFNAEVIDRYFGRKLTSLRFILASFFLSSIVFAIVVYLLSLRSRSGLGGVFASSANFGFGFAAFLFLAFLIIDCLCNYASIRILQMAAAIGSLSCLGVSLLANIFLTISIFTLVFPFGVICSLYANIYLHPTYNARLTFFPAGTVTTIQQGNTDGDGKEQLRLTPLMLSPLHANEFSASTSAPLLAVAPINVLDKDMIGKVTALLSNEPSRFVFSNDALLTLEQGLEGSINLVEFGRIYSAAYKAVEEVRNNFIGQISFLPYSLRVAAIYAFEKAANPEDSQGWVQCLSGDKHLIDVPNKDVGTLAEKGEEACNKKMIVGVIFANGGSISQNLKEVGAGDGFLPLSAFFISSFAISIFYYASLVLTTLALATNRYAALTFRNSIFNVSKLPFTFLGIILFFFFEPCLLFYRLFHYIVFG